MSFLGCLSWLEPQVRPVIDWSLSQILRHHCASTSCSQDRLWIQRCESRLVFQVHNWEPCLVIEDGQFRLHILHYYVLTEVTLIGLRKFQFSRFWHLPKCPTILSHCLSVHTLSLCTSLLKLFPSCSHLHPPSSLPTKMYSIFHSQGVSCDPFTSISHNPPC